eukprot:TRINITY_DN6938_c0_g1_i2.p1 TRINITY_DN6938_c0_g1~~TRINITY_DN6938_c0_g1_i2.p1  ORF type:complete len:454 (+),score=142.82 TRINITY_DN6938_c0_g1_i2:518-1879(+)
MVEAAFKGVEGLNWDAQQAGRCGTDGVAKEVDNVNGTVRVCFADGCTGWFPKSAVKRVKAPGSITPTLTPPPTPITPWTPARKRPRADFQEAACRAIVGRCEDLEKRYTRPAADREWDPAQVRGPDVLRKALVHVLQKGGSFDSEEEELRYMNEQMKSIRQDLTVQHVMTPLTTEAYEAHARVCLRKGDMAEFTACQAKIKGFHLTPSMAPDRETVLEFTAYRIMFCALVGAHAELEREIRDTPRADLRSPVVKHAMEVVRAAVPPNAARLRKLSESAPHMGRLLIGLFLTDSPARGLRASLYTELLQAYRPSVSHKIIADVLMVTCDAQLKQWLAGAKAVPHKDGGIETIKSLSTLRQVKKELATRKDFSATSTSSFASQSGYSQGYSNGFGDEDEWWEEGPDLSKIGWWIEGMDGEPWGEVVDDGGAVWMLDSGRVAKKRNRNSMWRWSGW